MPDTFTYRPKFVDVRVKKPAKPEAPPTDAPACEHMGCLRAGGHRAPKGRGFEGQYWRFCAEHAEAYNRSYNYFSGMSDGEFADFAASEAIGHRPTWSFKAGARDRLMSGWRPERAAGSRRDPFEMFAEGQRLAAEAEAPKRSRLQILALETLGLEVNAEGEAVRVRYAELVKRFHPDANGGDRSREDQLHRVIKAFQTLKAAGVA